MFTPSKKKQKGGAYITSTLDPSTLTTASVTTSTISTYGDIASLSISQISDLISTVTDQITTESANIVSTRTQITSIEADIDRMPGGYQNLYDIANTEYISVQTAYSSAKASLESDQSTLSSMLEDLDRLSTLSSVYTSSLHGYESEYSTIWDAIQANNSTIAAEDVAYQGRLRNYMSYQVNYSTAVTKLESTLQALSSNSSILSTATHDYLSTSTMYSALLEDYLHFSTTNLAESQYQYTSTNSYLSSVLDIQSTQLGNYMSTSTAYYIANLNVSTAQGIYDYRNALSIEQSTIIKYNDTENQLDQLLGGSGSHPISYYATQTPPTGQELAYNTLYLMLSSLSVAVFSTTQVRQRMEINQSTIFQTNLMSILNASDDLIEQAQSTYNGALQNRSSVISTMSGLSTRIGLAELAEQRYASTLSTVSSTYALDISTYNGIMQSISTYYKNQSTLSSYLLSTLITLSMLSTQSTIYNISAATYAQSYIGYSTIQATSQSSINGYSTIAGTMLSSVIGLDSEIASLRTTIGTEFVDLNSKANTYYANVKTDLNNELDAYKYGVQEWNSFIGYICSELLIHKLNLYTSIDSVTFTLQTNITQSTMTGLLQVRQEHVTKQQTIQNIIDMLNNLDTKFATLLEAVETERRDKMLFVDTRSVLTGYEINVLEDETKKSILQSSYINQLAALNSRVDSINGDILQRNQQMSALYTTINPQMNIINGLNVISYVLPDPLDTNIGPFNLDMRQYQLLEQLDYGLNPAFYPLVLTTPTTTTQPTTTV
jgi:hypothetical protein